jgi:futalosine hydrolase
VLLVVAATERELDSVRDVDVLVCGVGPVEAALATACEIERRRPEAILHVGIAGSRMLEPLAHVIGSESIYCDVDVQGALPKVDRVRPDPALVEAAQRALPHAYVLPIATSGLVGGGTACDVEAMEGFGVLRAAELAGVPAVEVRTISNLVSDDRLAWRIDKALAALAEAVALLVAEFQRA